MRWLVVAALAGAAYRVVATPRTAASVFVALPAPIVPPATVVVQAPPPAPAPAAPPPPVPVIGTTCGADLEHVGVPFVAGMATTSDERFRGLATASDGCVIAAFTEHALHVSWDGGQTFARLVTEGQVTSLAVAADRIAVLRGDGMLGVVRPGGALVWRPRVEAIVLADHTQLGVYLVGARLVELASYDANLAAISDDDGATWRYVAPPAGASLTGVADDALFAIQNAPPVETLPANVDPQSLRAPVLAEYRAPLAHPSWRKTRAPATPVIRAGDWRYTLELDKEWGCGSSQKLIAHHGDAEVELLDDLRNSAWPVELYSSGKRVIGTFNNHLYTLAGARLTDRGELPESFVIAGIDRDGTVIAQSADAVVRWSASGGWRLLRAAS